MTQGTMLRSRILGAACVMVFAGTMAMAQTAPDIKATAPETAAPADAEPKAKAKQPEKKTQKGAEPAKAASSEAKPRRGQYGSEAEARAHCKGEVVWIDKDNFNHYAGSREYGRKPGAFVCENG